MDTKRCVAMILAGGRGERLGGLSRYYSKPAVCFGGNRRIIDFTLNNCFHSKISTIGILSQYLAADLHKYIETAHSNRPGIGDVYMLPPKSSEHQYTATADAVYKNMAFINSFDPANVLILSGDHIYNMDYSKMLDFHEENDADLTMAATPVPFKEAFRFGILNAADNGRVLDFEEKPSKPKSNTASMGVYIFKWSALKRYLLADSKNNKSHHDFGKDIIPEALCFGERVYAYRFEGYWRDVGTISSLWEANMDQIDNPDAYGLESGEWEMPSSNAVDIPIMMSGKAVIRNSIVSGGCSVFGKLEHSVLSDSVTVGEDSEIINSVIMPGAYIGNNVKLFNTIVGSNSQIMDDTIIGSEHGLDFFVNRQMCSRGVSLVSPWLHIAESMRFQKGSHIYKERLDQHKGTMDKASRLKYVDNLIGMYRHARSSTN